MKSSLFPQERDINLSIIFPQYLLAVGVIIPPGATSFEIDARPHFLSDGDALFCHGSVQYLIPDTKPLSMITIGDRAHAQNATSSVLENCLTDVFYVIRFMDTTGAVIMDGKMSALAFFCLTNAAKIRPACRYLLKNVKDFQIQLFGQISWDDSIPEAYVAEPPSAMQSLFIGDHLAIKPLLQHYEIKILINFLTDAAMSYAERSLPTILSVDLQQEADLHSGVSCEHKDAKQSIKSVRPFVKAAVQFALLPYPSENSREANFKHALCHSGIPFPKGLIDSLTQGFGASNSSI